MTAEKNPNEKLAEAIFEKLLAEGLVSADGKTSFIQNLAEGKLNESAWKVALEQLIKSKQQKSESHETPQA